MLIGGHAQGVEEAPDHVGRQHGRARRVEAAQVHVQLAAGKPVRDLAGPAHRQRRLADTAGPVDGQDRDGAVVLDGLIKQAGERSQLAAAAHEVRDAGRQLVRHQRGGVAGRPGRAGLAGRARGAGRIRGRRGGQPGRPGLEDRGIRWVGVIGQAYPGDGGGLLDRDRDGPVGGGVTGRAVPDHLVEEPGRGDERQRPGGARQRGLERARVQQPERQVDRRGGDPVLVVVDLARMERHPEPDPLPGGVRRVVLPERAGQLTGHGRHEHALGHLRRDQDEHAVAAALLITRVPGDTRARERLLQGTVHAVTDYEPVLVGAPLVPEALDVHDENRAVHGLPRLLHPISRPRTHASNDPPLISVAILTARKRPG